MKEKSPECSKYNHSDEKIFVLSATVSDVNRDFSFIENSFFHFRHLPARFLSATSLFRCEQIQYLSSLHRYGRHTAEIRAIGAAA